MRFPFLKGKDHVEMLNNILESDELLNDNNLDESIQSLIVCLLEIDDVSEIFFSIKTLIIMLNSLNQNSFSVSSFKQL
jgi:hypothetical protein